MDPISAVFLGLTIIGWSVGIAFAITGYETFIPPIFRRYVLGQNIDNLRKDLMNLEFDGEDKEVSAQKILDKYPAELFERQQNFSDSFAMRIKQIAKSNGKIGYSKLILESGYTDLELGQLSYVLFKDANNGKALNEAFKDEAGYEAIIITTYTKEHAISNAKALQFLAKRERDLLVLESKTKAQLDQLQKIRDNFNAAALAMPAKIDVTQNLIQKLADKKFFTDTNLKSISRNKLEKYATKLGLKKDSTAHYKDDKKVEWKTKTSQTEDTSVTYVEDGNPVTLTYTQFISGKERTIPEKIWNGVKKAYKVTNAVTGIFTSKAVRSALTIFGVVFTIALIATGSMIVPLPALAIALGIVTLAGLAFNLAFRVGWNYYKMHKKQQIAEELMLQDEILLNLGLLSEKDRADYVKTFSGDREPLYKNGLVSPIMRTFAALSGYVVEDVFGDFGINTTKNVIDGNFLGPVSEATYSVLPGFISAPLNFLGRFGYLIGGFITVSIYAIWGEYTRDAFAKEGDKERATIAKMQLRADEIPAYKDVKQLKVKAKEVRDFVRTKTADNTGYQDTSIKRTVGEMLVKATLETVSEISYGEVANAYATATGASNKDNPFKSKFNNKDLDRGAKYALKATKMDKDGNLDFIPSAIVDHPKTTFKRNAQDVVVQ